MKTIEQIEAQMIELQKDLELLKNPPSYKRWRAEKGEKYYVINGRIVIQCIEGYGNTGKYNYDIGNYYKTEEEAEDAYKMQVAVLRINDKINKLNEGWEHNNKSKRYYIYFKENKYSVEDFSSNGYISPRILNFCKTKEIAEKIIAENKDDLDLIFNLK